ncbi:phosphate ABC transporter permease, partial [Klebsiella pneumoniae]
MNLHTISVPRIPIGDGFEAAIDWLRENFQAVFDFIGVIIDICVDSLTDLFSATSATQFTLLASAIIAVGLLSRGHRRPVIIVGAVWAG